MTTSSPEQLIPAALRATLERVAPQWPARLRQRWLADFVPYWRTDLVAEDRLTRYLTIALRRGWFDEAHGARRWSSFIALLERALARQGALDAAAIVNLFNLAAAAPAPGEALADQVGDSAWEELCGAALDARGLTAIVASLSPAGESAATQQARELLSPIVRVLDGGAVHARGARWLDGRWERAGWSLVHLVEPFGRKAWDGVSAVGIDQGRLVAYSRPLALVSHLRPARFPVEVARGEPSELVWPSSRAAGVEGMLGVFEWQGLWIGRTDDGAVAFLSEKG